MIARLLDVTREFNNENGVKLDLSEWETATFCFVNPSGTISITGTNEGGAVEGVTDGNATSSTNYTTIQATNLATGSAVTSVAAAGNYRVAMATKYVQFGGSGAAADKVLVELIKPY